MPRKPVQRSHCSKSQWRLGRWLPDYDPLSPKRPTPTVLNLNGRALPAVKISNNVFRPNLAAPLQSRVACNYELKLKLRRNVKRQYYGVLLKKRCSLLILKRGQCLRKEI